MAKDAEADLVAKAKAIRETLPKLTKLPKELGEKVFDGEFGKLEQSIAKVQGLNAERSVAVAEKRLSKDEVRRFIKRVASSVKGIYGDDSNEYQAVGGKRASLRKKPVRKPKVQAAK